MTADDVINSLVKRFHARANLCRELERIAADATRWHDAATMKSHACVWERAIGMVREEQPQND